MPRVDRLEPVFTEFIPPEKELKRGKLYISMQYTTTVHLCASGCGEKVVLPLSPAKWRLEFDGDSVSMSPSVGNWNLTCRSHYWIRNNRVVWAGAWGDKRIAAGRRHDEQDVNRYFEQSQAKGKEVPFWERVFRRR